MNARLLPWIVMALLVLVLAVRSSLSGKGVAAPAEASEPGTAGGGPEIRLGPVEVREFHDDGSLNRLDAEEAVYAYASRMVTAGRVTVLLGNGAPLAGTTVRAPRAAWNLDGKTIALPGGCRVSREGGWAGVLSAGTIDLAANVLRVPGPARIEGPGFSVDGKNLAWKWEEGKITMESPRSHLLPAARPGRKG